MNKKIEVKCEAGCEAGFIAVADNGGDGIEHVECGQHPAFEDKLIILDEVRTPTGATGYVVGFDGEGNVLVGGSNILGG